VSDTLNTRLSEGVTGRYGVLPYRVTGPVTFGPGNPQLSPCVTRRIKEFMGHHDLLNSLPSSPHRAFCGFRYGQRVCGW
jgi:hypothetical protein